MNSFIYEVSAFEKNFGKTSFESDNLVTSSIGSNAKEAKIFPIPRYKEFGVKNIWKFIKEIPD